MGVEIEKKYRLTEETRELLLKRLAGIGALPRGEEFEENTIYGGGVLSLKDCALRLRRVNETAVLTYKERYPSNSKIKHQREDETRVEDGEQMAAILGALGFSPTLVYEKRRITWRVGTSEVVVDELPFGLFAEIEGSDEEITRVESLLHLQDTEAEPFTYPQLTLKFGVLSEGRIEARFDEK